MRGEPLINLHRDNMCGHEDCLYTFLLHEQI